MSRDARITVRWRSFELRPEPVPTLDPDGDYLVSAWRNHVYPLAAKLQIPLKRPPVQPRSRLAHEAAKWAAGQGRFEEYNLALFRAFFQHGKNIGDISVLKNLAAALHLDAESLHLSLQNGDFTAMVIADENEAKEIGVRAVPAFAANRTMLAAGVQTSKRLWELLNSVL